MTEEQKRIKIAEKCGWKRTNNGEPSNRRFPGDTKSAYWCSPDGAIYWDSNYVSNNEALPNYFSDLNAMHEAEKVLKDHEIEQYNDLLGSFLWSGYPASRRNFHATAAQRAEAFGRTLGLWT